MMIGTDTQQVNMCIFSPWDLSYSYVVRFYVEIHRHVHSSNDVFLSCFSPLCVLFPMLEEFEETQGVIRIRKIKKGQTTLFCLLVLLNCPFSTVPSNFFNRYLPNGKTVWHYKINQVHTFYWTSEMPFFLWYLRFH